jgi:CheY-like chemotaxis protein
MKLLVIEDEVKLAEYLRKGLTEEGYVVDVAHNGVDGLHLAMEGDYDLLVLDGMLPGIDGLGVLAACAEQANACADADGARPGRGPCQGSARGRRRLPRQAVRVLRTGGPDPGPAAPRPAGART